MTRWLANPLVGPAVATIVVALLVMSTTDRFLMAGNLNNLALQVSIVALVAIGSTAVIFIGGIDLSPGSALALLTMVLACMLKFWGISFWPAIVLTLLLGAGIGALNGFITAYLRIPAFITTLAGFSAYRGLAFMFNRVQRLRPVGAAVLRQPLRHPAASHLHGGVLRDCLLADAIYAPWTLDLRRGRQCKRRAPVRH